MQLKLPVLGQFVDYKGGDMRLRSYMAIVQTAYEGVMNKNAAQIANLVSRNKHLTEENQRLRAAAILNTPPSTRKATS